MLWSWIRGQPQRTGARDDARCSGLAQRGLVAYGFPPTMFETSAIAFCALALLPAASSGGEITAIANLPGHTAMMPPPTPLLAGSPVWKSHLPESSYRPAVAMTASTLGTLSVFMYCFLVTGFFPPFASVAAMVARSLALTLTAHCSV